jgi:hypothetical protein
MDKIRCFGWPVRGLLPPCGRWVPFAARRNPSRRRDGRLVSAPQGKEAPPFAQDCAPRQVPPQGRRYRLRRAGEAGRRGQGHPRSSPSTRTSRAWDSSTASTASMHSLSIYPSGWSYRVDCFDEESIYVAAANFVLLINRMSLKFLLCLTGSRFMPSIDLNT